MKKSINFYLKIITISTLQILAFQSGAQNVVISENESTADASAILDVQSTSKGILIPRMTEAQKIAIDSAAAGLMIYQTDGDQGFYYYSSGSWDKMQKQVDRVVFSAILNRADPITNGDFINLTNYTDERVDTHDSFDPATGVFTAPVDGLYAFTAMISLENLNTGANYIRSFSYIATAGQRINRNGFERYYSGAPSQSFKIDAVYMLTKDEQVYVRVWVGDNHAGASLRGAANSPESSTRFSGYLIR